VELQNRKFKGGGKKVLSVRKEKATFDNGDSVKKRPPPKKGENQKILGNFDKSKEFCQEEGCGAVIAGLTINNVSG